MSPPNTKPVRRAVREGIVDEFGRSMVPDEDLPPAAQKANPAPISAKLREAIVEEVERALG